MKIIGFVGLPGSGKGEASKIARQQGLAVVVMGDVIRQEAARQGIEPTDQNLGRIGNALRAEDGPEAIAKRTLKMARATGKELVVVDGLRSKVEADYFRARAEEFHLVEVSAPVEARMRWLEARGRPDDPKRGRESCGSASATNPTHDSQATAALEQRESREMGWGMHEAMLTADFRLENNGDLSDLRRNVERLLVRLTTAAGASPPEEKT